MGDALRALQGAASISAAARAAGCSRAMLLRRAEEDQRVAEAVLVVSRSRAFAASSARTWRRRRASVRAAMLPELLADPDVALGLATLRAVARGERGDDEGARVSAARALLAWGAA